MLFSLNEAVSMRVLMVLVGLLFGVIPATGQEQPRLWGGVEAGAYAVGFRLVQTYDYTRSYVPKHMPDGQPTSGPRARPMHLGLWYPASVPAGAEPMPFGTYRWATLPQPGLPALTQADSLMRASIFRARLASFKQATVSDIAFTHFMQRPTAAYQDAPPHRGPFPLVVLGSGLEHEMLLAEFLASHGYVVVSPAVLDPGLAQEPTTWEQYHNAVHDLTFAMAHAQQLPFVASDRTGTLGFGGGGIYTYLLAMQSPEVDAVVSLESALFMEPWLSILEELPYYRPDRFGAALLHVMRRSESERAENLEAYDALLDADRFRVLLEAPHLQHGDIGSYWLQLTDGLDYQPEGYAATAATNRALLQTIRLFFDAALKDDASAQQRLLPAEQPSEDALLTVIHDPGRKASPHLMHWVALFKQEGFSVMQDAFNHYFEAHPSTYTPPAFEQAGIHLLRSQQLPEAVAVYRLFEQTFPASAQAAYRLALSLERLGEAEEAQAVYTTCLERLAADSTLDETSRGLLQERAEQALHRLSN